jgi:hypothetical protein
MKLDFEYLEQNFLPYVEKPDRYIGNEINLPELTDDPQLRVVPGSVSFYIWGIQLKVSPASGFSCPGSTPWNVSVH